MKASLIGNSVFAQESDGSELESTDVTYSQVLMFRWEAKGPGCNQFPRQTSYLMQAISSSPNNYNLAGIITINQQRRHEIQSTRFSCSYGSREPGGFRQHG